MAEAKLATCGSCGTPEAASCLVQTDGSWQVHRHTCTSCGVTVSYRADGPVCSGVVGTLFGSGTSASEAYDAQALVFGESVQHPQSRGPEEVERREKAEAAAKKK